VGDFPLNIKEFAQKYRVNTKRDSCGEDIVVGSIRPDGPARPECASHIYQNDSVQFGLFLPFRTKTKWTFAKKKLVAAGFTIKQDGDTEGIALFNPEDRKQVRVAFRVGCIRVRQEVTPERREALIARLNKPKKPKTAPALASTLQSEGTFGAGNDAGASE
jgi:hypothetical protein